MSDAAEKANNGSPECEQTTTSCVVTWIFRNIEDVSMFKITLDTESIPPLVRHDSRGRTCSSASCCSR